MTELAIQLGTVFITSTSVQQFSEVGVPWILQKVQLYLESRKIKKVSHHEAEPPTQAEAESKCSEYPSTFDDYNEIAIQFGYVTLFAAAFPLAPFAALLNNLVEGRSDLIKLFKGMQRPHPREASNIGTWIDIMEAISYLATITNSAIIVFTSTELQNLYPGMSGQTKLMIALVAEHLIFLLKFLIQKFIPDAPAWVKEAYARKIYFKQLHIEQAKEEESHKKAHTPHTPHRFKAPASSLVNLEEHEGF